jgi:hypothetical protein
LILVQAARDHSQSLSGAAVAQVQQVAEMTAAAEGTTEQQAAALAALWRGMEALEGAGKDTLALPEWPRAAGAANSLWGDDDENENENGGKKGSKKNSKNEKEEEKTPTSPLSASTNVQLENSTPSSPPLTPIQKAMQLAGVENFYASSSASSAAAAAPPPPPSTLDKENSS